jgi:hypothetical protein
MSQTSFDGNVMTASSSSAAYTSSNLAERPGNRGDEHALNSQEVTPPSTERHFGLNFRPECVGCNYLAPVLKFLSEIQIMNLN